MSKKKILMIAYTDYRFEGRVRREAETLVRSGEFDVTLLTLKESFSPRIYTTGGVTVYEVNQSKYEGENKIFYILSYFNFFFRCLFLCTSLFFKKQADIIHIHNMPDFLVFTSIVPKLFGCKIILDIHDSMPETYLSKFSDQFSLAHRILCLEESSSAQFSHRVICVNDIQKEAVTTRGIRPEKVTVSLNVPDPVFFPITEKVSSYPTQSDSFNLIYHGTIAERTGVDLIIRSISQLVTKIPEIQFHLWSKEGFSLDKVKELGFELGLNSHIKIVEGGVPFENLSKELKNMHLGVIGNRKGIATELMLPVKMLEYVFIGIPVVAPRLKCIQHYFNDDMVSFYDPGDVNDMSYAIYNLYKDKNKRSNQIKAANKFVLEYHWDNHQESLLNMYRNL